MGGGVATGTAAAEIDFSEALRSGGSLKSDEGKVVLEWGAPAQADPPAVELEQAGSPDFSDAYVRYAGTDHASAVTGLPEGDHYFRIRTTDGGPGPWSQPLKLEVEFIEEKILITLLVAGAVVALLTAGAVVTGHLRTRDGGGGPR